MYEGIKETIYRLFPDVYYDPKHPARDGKHYNKALGYEVSRRLIQQVAKHKDVYDYRQTINQLKVLYDGGSTMRVDELNLLYYYFIIDLPHETHTGICERCGSCFDYDVILAKETLDTKGLKFSYLELEVEIPTICAHCAELF